MGSAPANNHNSNLEQHKPGRIKRVPLSLQNQNGYTFDVCRVKYPGTKQQSIHISGAGFTPNSQIWLLGTTPFDTTPFICLRVIIRVRLIQVILAARTMIPNNSNSNNNNNNRDHNTNTNNICSSTPAEFERAPVRLP